MNDISVLRQVTSTTSNAPAVLFRPAGAIRSVSRGVSIDYFLKTAANAVTLEILDSGGSVIRRFTGPAPEKPESTPQGDGGDDSARPPTPRAPGKQGMNRFTWDMRYAGARDFPGLLHTVARLLHQHGLEVSRCEIRTEEGVARDRFFVASFTGAPAEPQLRAFQGALLGVIAAVGRSAS